VNLIFRNCEAYNAPKKSEHMMSLGKYGTKAFRKLFLQRMKAYENPEFVVEKKREVSPANFPEQPQKKVKIEATAAQVAPRMVSSAAPTAITSSTPARAKSVSPKPPSSISNKLKSAPPAISNLKPNQPVPLHVAIAQVKERFPLRRPYKLLEDWEGSCAKFFKELMRHPWISAARPKFIFHVPVPVLFPELKEAYVNKVKRPMDLTTAEAKLLQGGLYSSPQDFVDDVALVFANAITFNKAGRDEGDPLSIAYYDASIHLLRYTRWLSLEWLGSDLTDDPHVDPPGENNMPPSSWKLSKLNHQVGREEMQRIVLQEAIEKSFEGDRYTWMETECEKLLKSLRHQSDLRYMTFFLQPSFPPDYTAYISKPIAWENCYKALQKRQYDRMGDIIEDLRLIFVNALKYNSRHQGLDTVSGKAYDAAVYMSAKLEAAIDKMMVTVADRLERERIDTTISERELEVQERAEDERIRAAIKDGTLPAMQPAPGHVKVETSVETTTRVFNRRPLRKEIDFDVAFVDEDDGNHEQSHVEMMRQQKATFERQRQQHNALASLALSTGAMLFARMNQCDQATRWVTRMAQLTKPKVDVEKKDKETKEDDSKKTTNDSRLGSSVLTELEKSDRQQISLKPMKLTVNKKRKKAPPNLDFE
jgi:Bromodomain